jgi:pseudouridine-5'-phosphate glycosidase
MNSLPASFIVKDDVKRALKLDQPVVALESTVLTHGLPPPTNLALGRDMEAAILADGATPATIAVLRGTIRVGLTDDELIEVAQSSTMKISRRDFAAAIAQKAGGGTTVAGTMFAADKAGIKVFATGGIGGIHKEGRFDVSTDLQALASTQMIVVCAGAKSILDLPSTLEMLETLGVPVVGYGTDEFPAFFSRSSGFKTSARVDSPQEAADFARAHWEIGMPSAVLICQPISETDEIPREEIDPIEEQASREAQEKGISGQALTPFLLQRVNELTNGKSMRANISFLLNNAHLAAQIAKSLSPAKPKIRAI